MTCIDTSKLHTDILNPWKILTLNDVISGVNFKTIGFEIRKDRTKLSNFLHGNPLSHECERLAAINKHETITDMNTVLHTLCRMRVPSMLEEIHGSKSLSSNVGHQQVSRCHTRGEPEESIRKHTSEISALYISFWRTPGVC